MSEENSEEAPKGGTSLSFKVAAKLSSRKVAKTTVQGSFKTTDDRGDRDDDGGEKEYIVEADGKSLKTTGKSSSKLVIPMIAKNKWNRNEGGEGEDLDAAAADEIIAEMREAENGEGKEDVAYIPLMMRNRVPMPADGREMNEKYDISMRPEESTLEDYSNVPVKSFGSALLRGMGWSEGAAIGNTNKGICEPIEYIPRHKGLGLGAEKRNEDSKYQRKRKLGDPAEAVDKYKPIIDKDGRVRHVKKVGEKAEDHSASGGMCVGSIVRILKNPHKGLLGRVVSVDADTARISITLELSGEMIHISQYNAELVDKDELKNEKQNTDAKNQNSTSQKTSQKNGEKTNSKHNTTNGNTKHDSSPSKPPWLQNDIRVRIVSKTFQDGRYYNKKVSVIDVTSIDRCMCRTDERDILNNVRERYLETVVPKAKGSYVKVLTGRLKGKHARLVSRSKADETVTLQMLDTKEVERLTFDDVSEFVGRLPGEDVL